MAWTLGVELATTGRVSDSFDKARPLWRSSTTQTELYFAAVELAVEHTCEYTVKLPGSVPFSINVGVYERVLEVDSVSNSSRLSLGVWVQVQTKPLTNRWSGSLINLNCHLRYSSMGYSQPA